MNLLMLFLNQSKTNLEESGFSFEFVSKLDIKCEKVIVLKDSSFFQSYNCSRYKQNIDRKFF